jgi:hypothetical protein
MKQIGQTQEYILGAGIVGLPPALLGSSPVILEQLNALLEGLAPKDNVRVATVSNINLLAPGANVDGIDMAAKPNKRVLVKNQTLPETNGLFFWNGPATPMTRTTDGNLSEELHSAVVSVDEGSNAGTTWRQTSVHFILDTDPIAWVPFGNTAPPATTSTAGLARYATQSEVNLGTVSTATVTPETLNNWTGRRFEGEDVIGDGSASTFDVVHGRNKYNISVKVYRNSGNRDEIEVETTHPNLNTVRVIFASPPGIDSYVVAWKD